MASESFAGRLRELRIAAGLTQPALAAKAGLTKDGIAHLEQGRRSPSWETVLALAAALGVDCTAFNEVPREAPAPGRGRPRKADGGAEPSDQAGAEANADKPADATRSAPRSKKKRKRG
jgi:transcriptional regulator with XRE-family HTH domain